MIVGWALLTIYIIGFGATWVISVGLMRNNEHMFDEREPILSIIMISFFGLIMAFVWPLVVLGFFVYRVATITIKGGED